MLSLKFYAVEGVDVSDPIALDAGVHRIIGKTFDGQAQRVNPEGATLNLDDGDARRYRALFAKHVRLGELKCLDDETARALGCA